MAKRDDIFKGAMATLGLTFNRETGPLMDAYWEVLSCLSEPELIRAFSRAVSECRFFPVPAEFLALAGRAPRDVAGEATLAWDAVRRAMDALDVYGNPDFGPLVNAVVRNLGGWLYMCEQKASELEWRRKDFERVYRLWAEKSPDVLPEGGPLFGEWKHAPVTRVQIPGLPEQLPALESVQTSQAQEMRQVVRELAQAKSAPEAPAPSPDAKHPAERIPGRPKAPPMSAEEVEAKKAEINQRMAEWRKKNEEAA